MGRAPCCDKASVKKGPWSPEEDAKLKSYIEQHGTGGNWIALPQKIGLKRCGKSCRLRWLNYLRPNIKHGGFSEEEDNIICSLYISIGSRWSIIAAQLPGRTDNDIKNYWNTRLKKKLLGNKQRNKDPNPNRRAGALKQEARKEVNGSNLQPNGYWPDPSMPMYPISQSEHRVSDEHSSIRRLLMKLGGRFSTETQIPYAVPAEQQVYDASAALVAPNSVMNEDLAGSSGYNSTELDDMFCNSVKLEGLDCFYGMGNVMDESNVTSSSDNTNTNANWNEVSPLINYQPMINPSYSSMQSCLFEESVRLGTQ
ncbi:uncharacterized protein A4U43_C03F7580 [Asparagus officinalis]|uniref:Uncharacterized protein n=1 Tax=Asparagus officinalis TaxID=4686 RepID=A0A5P1F8Q0_ASPOF|nr:transcription factor RAX1-like [Asparagus officinalis]ONK74552.1 uncharacterized protein A4U43_C03F7580 [Asparagus officinalis]